MAGQVSCWWGDALRTYLSLTSLGTSAPWDTPKGPRVYTDGVHSFYEKDIEGNFDEVEEALWALRNGL